MNRLMPSAIKFRVSRGKRRVEFYYVYGLAEPDLVLFNVNFDDIINFFEPYLKSEKEITFDRKRKMLVIRDKILFEKAVLFSALMSNGVRARADFVKELVNRLSGFDIHFWVSNLFEYFSTTKNSRSINRVIKAFKILYGLV